MMNVYLLERREEIKSGQAEMKCIVNASIGNTRDEQKETLSSQLMTEACLHSKELYSEDMESEVEHSQVPMEEAA
jgi:hypothetical protein